MKSENRGFMAAFHPAVVLLLTCSTIDSCECIYLYKFVEFTSSWTIIISIKQKITWRILESYLRWGINSAALTCLSKKIFKKSFNTKLLLWTHSYTVLYIGCLMQSSSCARNFLQYVITSTSFTILTGRMNVYKGTDYDIITNIFPVRMYNYMKIIT